jgi:hypothetical protein
MHTHTPNTNVIYACINDHSCTLMHVYTSTSTYIVINKHAHACMCAGTGLPLLSFGALVSYKASIPFSLT